MKIRHVIWVSLFLALCALPLGAAPQEAQAGPVDQRLQAAANVFQEIMSTPESIPRDLLSRAQCVAIVPSLKKGAFVVGAEYGKGFITCRNANASGWSAPAAITIGGGSFGFQIGGQETDVVMLLMNKGAEHRLLSSKFTLGADASVAAGPVGRTAQAQTGEYLSSEILSWSRSRGAFAGVSLKGASVSPDKEADALLYGRSLTNTQIVEGNLPVPQAAQPLNSELDRYAKPQSANGTNVK